jgi:crotonobetainyl-CoA:carnitine CoA-transferase CaiB-like acyl-CoA transferase
VGLFQSFDHPTEGRVKLSVPPASFSKTPAEIGRQAPRLGENGAELLRELGYSEAEVATMRESGALIEGGRK